MRIVEKVAHELQQIAFERRAANPESGQPPVWQVERYMADAKRIVAVMTSPENRERYIAALKASLLKQDDLSQFDPNSNLAQIDGAFDLGKLVDSILASD
jgi:hypothetical protein